MSEEGKRILDLALAQMRHHGGRGRPKQTARQKIERQNEASRLIGELLRRGPKWGEMKLLEQLVQRKYGITRAEFYKIVKKMRYWLPIANRLAAENALIEANITPAELDRWRHRSADAVLILAAKRARKRLSVAAEKKAFSLD